MLRGTFWGPSGLLYAKTRPPANENRNDLCTLKTDIGTNKILEKYGGIPCPFLGMSTCIRCYVVSSRVVKPGSCWLVSFVDSQWFLYINPRDFDEKLKYVPR